MRVSEADTASGTALWLVFVSHAGTDTWVARRIAERVEACGAKAFLDDADIAVGDDFEERILDALDRASELLVLLTPWSLDRPYVWAEIGAAWKQRIPIIGVLYGLTPEQLHAQARILVFLKKRDLTDSNQLDAYFKELRERVMRGKVGGG